MTTERTTMTTSVRPLIYVAGPMGGDLYNWTRNRWAAQKLGMLLRGLGADVYVPHVSSWRIEDMQDEPAWIAEGRRWVARCDALAFWDDSSANALGVKLAEESRGTMGEIELAQELDIPVLLAQLDRINAQIIHWIKAWKARCEL
jgi:hypothetical protein